MEKTKLGFVYIWYDRKHKRFYIGSHWGHEDDGYICSSRWMRNSYRRRPQDFKKPDGRPNRRILTRVDDRKDLLEEEHKWLSLIKNEELGKRYYNISKHHFGHWSTDKNKLLTVGQKISASPLRNQRIGEGNKGKIISEDQKEKNRIATIKQYANSYYREFNRQKSLELWQDPEYRKVHVERKKGRFWFTNGVDDFQTWECPDGFWKGRSRVSGKRVRRSIE